MASHGTNPFLLGQPDAVCLALQQMISIDGLLCLMLMAGLAGQSLLRRWTDAAHNSLLDLALMLPRNATYDT